MNIILVGGIPTPLKNVGVNVSWEYDIPSIWKNKIHVPNHQPVYIYNVYLTYIYIIDSNSLSRNRDFV